VIKNKSTNSLNEDLEHLTIDDIFANKGSKKRKKSNIAIRESSEHKE
jgi:hypothetical protein